MEPFVMLDQGEWLGYSCLARSAWFFTSRFLILSAFVWFGTLTLSFKLWSTVKFKGDPLLPFERRTLPVIFQAIGISIFFYSFYEATTYSRETLYLSGSVLTETGCHALQAYTETFDLVGARAEFQNHVWKGSDRSHMIVTRPNQRPIVINLSDSKFYTNLAGFAPEVMGMYVQRLTKDHEPIPTELQKLSTRE